MKKEPSDKLPYLQRHGLLAVIVGIISPEKRNSAVLGSEDAVVADGDPVGISAEILQDTLGTIEGRFAIDDPLLMVKMSLEGFEGSEFLEMADTSGEYEITRFEAFLQKAKKLTVEQCRQDPYVNKEAFAA
jgi:hypothetical protein